MIQRGFEVTWQFLPDPALWGVTAPKTWSWLMAGHCSRNEQNRWAVCCRASSPNISLSLLLTSINKKQLPLRNCDEERCLTINQLISRREHQTRETFLRGFSGKPHTAQQTLILGTSSSKLITSSFYCHQMTNNLGLMHLCIQVHQNGMSGDKRWINHRSQIPVLGAPGAVCNEMEFVAPLSPHTGMLLAEMSSTRQWQRVLKDQHCCLAQV